MKPMSTELFLQYVALITLAGGLLSLALFLSH